MHKRRTGEKNTANKGRATGLGIESRPLESAVGVTAMVPHRPAAVTELGQRKDQAALLGGTATREPGARPWLPVSPSNATTHGPRATRGATRAHSYLGRTLASPFDLV